MNEFGVFFSVGFFSKINAIFRLGFLFTELWSKKVAILVVITKILWTGRYLYVSRGFNKKYSPINQHHLWINYVIIGNIGNFPLLLGVVLNGILKGEEIKAKSRKSAYFTTSAWIIPYTGGHLNKYTVINQKLNQKYYSNTKL